MSPNRQIPGSQEKVKRALCWIGETLLNQPGRSREVLLREAEIRFDLSPAECEFLNRNFIDPDLA